MQIVKLSNLFCELVEQSQFFQNYHFGYHSDINTTIINKFNPDGLEGTKFPLVLWAAPVEGSLSALNGQRGTNNVQVDLYFYDLQGRDLDGFTIQQSLLETWDRLHSHAVEFLTTAQKSGVFGIQNRNITWLTDANLHNDRLLCVGLTFTAELPFACEDYELEHLQPVDDCAISSNKDQEHAQK